MTFWIDETFVKYRFKNSMTWEEIKTQQNKIVTYIHFEEYNNYHIIVLVAGVSQLTETI